MYAYIHFQSKLPSIEIVKALPIEEMLEHYYTGHKMNKKAYYNKIKERLKSANEQI